MKTRRICAIALYSLAASKQASQVIPTVSDTRKFGTVRGSQHYVLLPRLECS